MAHRRIAPEPLVEARHKGGRPSILELLRNNSVPAALRFFLKYYRQAMPHEMDEMYNEIQDDLSPEKWSKLPSKYEGTCFLCDKAITVGMPILWRKPTGMKSFTAHIECFYESGNAGQMSDDLVREAVDVLRKKLEECRQVIDELLTHFDSGGKPVTSIPKGIMEGNRYVELKRLREELAAVEEKLEWENDTVELGELEMKRDALKQRITELGGSDDSDGT